MKRTLNFWLVILLAAAMLPMARADIIVLKNSERKKGKIIAEDILTITLEYQLTTKIRDRILIRKVDIAEIIRETSAQLEFEENRYADLIPSRDLMTVTDYDNVLERLRLFATKHPGSPETRRVQDIIASLEDDRTRALAGGVKAEGAWLDAAAVKREQYEIDAYRCRFTMKNKLADPFDKPTDSKEATALREFEELRRGFPSSMQFVKAIPEALEILEAYGTKLEVMAKEYPVLTSKRDQALEALAPTGTVRDLFLRTDTAMTKEQRTFQEKFEAQTKAGTKWRDVYKYDLQSIELAQVAVQAERKELEAIDLPALQFENENLSGARRCLLDGKPAEAEVFIKRLRPMRGTLMNEVAFEELERLLAQEAGR